MKEINLYVLGKYKYDTKVGTWIFYLEYRGAVMKRSGTVRNGISHVRMSLYAIGQALACINEPCIIHIHSNCNLGFKNIKQSRNAHIISDIQHRMINAGHMYKMDTETKFDNLIMSWEEKYGKKKEVKQSEVKKDYDKMIEEQAMQSKDWRAMYSDLMGPSQGTWVPGSGGY